MANIKYEYWLKLRLQLNDWGLGFLNQFWRTWESQKTPFRNSARSRFGCLSKAQREVRSDAHLFNYSFELNTLNFDRRTT